MSAMSKREIRFVLKMQNESRAVIKEFGKDLAEALGKTEVNVKSITQSVEKLASGTGVNKLADGFNKVREETAEVAKNIETLATGSATGKLAGGFSKVKENAEAAAQGIGTSADAVGEYQSQIKVLETSTSRAFAKAEKEWDARTAAAQASGDAARDAGDDAAKAAAAEVSGAQRVISAHQETRRAVEQMRDALQAARENMQGFNAEAGKLGYVSKFNDMANGVEEVNKRARKATELFADVKEVVDDMQSMESIVLFADTDYGAQLAQLRELGANAVNLASVDNRDYLDSAIQAKVQSVQQLIDKYGSLENAAVETMAEARKAAEQAERGQLKFNEAVNQTSRAWKIARVAIAATMAFLGGNAIIREADAWKTLTGQLRLVTDGERNLLAVRRAVADVAFETRSDLESTTQLYVKLAQRADQLGKSQQDVLQITENFSKAMQVGGSSAAEAAAATRQFAQAVAAGSLQGDELNSIIENAPGLAMAFEQGLRDAGKEVTSLKAYIADAKPTILELLDALDSQTDDINDKFSQLPLTVSQGLTMLKSAFTEFVGNLDESSKATDGLATFLARIADLLRSPEFINAVTGLANLFGKVLNFALDTVSAAFAWMKENIDTVITATITLTTLYIAFKWNAIVTAVTSLAAAFASKALAIWASIAALGALKIALIATGIGAFIVVVGTLVSWLYEYGNATMKVSGWTVTGWQKIKAVVVGAWAAITTAASIAWNNLRVIYKNWLNGIGLVGTALARLASGDFAGAFMAGAGAADIFNKAVSGLNDVLSESGKAWQAAHDQSIVDSGIKNLGGGIDEMLDPGVSTNRPDAQRVVGPGSKNDKDSKREAEQMAKALKAIRDRIEETEKATEEQRRMNAEIRKGPAAVRELERALAGERATREALKELEKAGHDISKGSVAWQEAQRAGAAATTAELEKQRQALSNLAWAQTENIANMKEQQATSLALLAGQMTMSAGTLRQQSLTADYNDRLEELNDSYRDGQWAVEEYTEEMHEAEKEARRFAAAQQLLRDGQLVLNTLIPMGTKATEEARIRYEMAAQAYRNWAEAAKEAGRALAPDIERRAKEGLERLRPPDDIFDAVNKGLRGFMDDIEPSLLKVADLSADIFNRVGDAIGDLVVTGKANFGDLARSIIADLSRMIVKALIFKAVSSIFGLPTGHSGGIAGAVGHSGGIAGMGQDAVRAVSSAAFQNVRKYHTGGLAGGQSLSSDEIPIIAKRNEAILPTVRLPDGNFGVKADMGGAGGGGVFAPQFNVHLPKSEAASRVADLPPEMQAKFASMLEDEMNIHLQRKMEEWTRPGGQLTNAMNRR